MNDEELLTKSKAISEKLCDMADGERPDIVIGVIISFIRYMASMQDHPEVCIEEVIRSLRMKYE